MKKIRKDRAKRRPVEIYFILYLSAILLLIPDRRERTSAGDSSLISALLEMNFSIMPEKPVLNCRLINSPDGSRILAIDSVNTISAFGNVSDVRYEFSIEDHSLRQMLTLNSDRPAPTQFFRMKEDISQGIARFYWMPQPNERQNRNFTVRVIARAKPTIPVGIRDESLRKQLFDLLEHRETTITAKTEFTVNVFFADGGSYAQNSPTQNNTLPQTDILGGTSQNPNFISPFSQIGTQTQSSEFMLVPRMEILEGIAFQQWINTVQIYGANLQTESKKPVKIAVFPEKTGDGSAEIEGIFGNQIRVRGTTPSSGSMKVRLTAERSTDNREVTVEFSVAPKPIPAPSIPKQMYPSLTYSLDPMLPLLAGQETKAVLYEGTQERAVSLQSLAFEFTPNENDIGKKLRFERSVNGNRIGEIYQIAIVEFPPPEIIDFYRQGDIYIVKTKTFGMKNGQNNRSVLSISGNATRRQERFGDAYFDAKKFENYQVFEIARADANAPFIFSMVAQDSWGKKSKVNEVK